MSRDDPRKAPKIIGGVGVALEDKVGESLGVQNISFARRVNQIGGVGSWRY